MALPERERELIQLREVREVAQPPVVFANPASIGLLAFGMTTTLLSLANANVYEVGTMILAMAVFFGGFMQLLAALMAYRRNDMMALTAFGGYSILWITLAFLLIGQEHGWAAANSSTAMGWYLFVWSIFGFGVFFASLVHPRMLTVVLFLTASLVFILALADWNTSDTIRKIGGWEGIVTGASAVYLAFALLLNNEFGRTILPVGKPLVGATK